MKCEGKMGLEIHYTSPRDITRQDEGACRPSLHCARKPGRFQGSSQKHASVGRLAAICLTWAMSWLCYQLNWGDTCDDQEI